MTLALSQEAKDWLATGKKFLYQDKFNIFFIDSGKKKMKTRKPFYYYTDSQHLHSIG